MNSTSINRPVIRITKGSEYRAQIEEIDQEDLFFFEAYKRAKYNIEDMWGVNGDILQSLKKLTKTPNIKDTRIKEELRGKVNNILAFCADRGQGKTTAMRSFSQELEKYNQKKSEFFKNGRLPKMHFIGSIDPTAMTSRDSILKMVISRMFNRFSEELQQREQKLQNNEYDSSTDISHERRVNRLAKQFTQCSREIDILYDGNQKDLDVDELEELGALGDSSNLIVSVFQLICEYLEFMGSHEEDSCLVIQIDDADLQIDGTYQLLEDIRKYLLIPNVIILLAANMGQLESTLEQYFLDKYEKSLKYSNSMINVDQCHAIAELYLEKIIPSSRRIFLPNLDSNWESIWVQYCEKSAQENRDYESANILKKPMDRQDIENVEWTYQNQILDLLHKKTGIVFVAPRAYLHNLVPGNMRELTHFLAYFNEIPDLGIDCYEEVLNVYSLTKSPDCLNQWKKNLESFEDYVVDRWSTANLRHNSRRFFIDFVNQPMSNKHGFVLQNLPDYYSKERRNASGLGGFSSKKEDVYREEFIQTLEARGVVLKNESQDQMPYDSYGSVMAALDVLSELPGAEMQYKFIYAIRIYYTILFHMMLIRRLAYPEKPVRQEDDIMCFMKEAFIKGRNGDWREFPLWCIELPAKEIDRIKGNTSTQGGEKKDEDVSYVNLCLRTNRRYNNAHYTDSFSAPVYYESSWSMDNFNFDQTGEKDGTRKVWFSPLYPILRGMDDFSYLCKPRTRIRYTRDTSEIYEARRAIDMYATFMILLNWDVLGRVMSSQKADQYIEPHKSKGKDNRAVTVDECLNKNFLRIYATSYMENLYQRIIDLTGKNYFSTDSKKQNEQYPYIGFAGIEGSMPSFYAFITKLFRRLKRYFEERHVDDVPPRVQQKEDQSNAEESQERFLEALKIVGLEIFKANQRTVMKQEESSTEEGQK